MKKKIKKGDRYIPPIRRADPTKQFVFNFGMVEVLPNGVNYV
jgi:hypothetical protein